MADTPRATSVYKYYDAFGCLVYVGITSTGIARNRQHNADKAWWEFVAHQTVEHFASRDEAHAREVELIKELGPPFNKQHNRKHAQLLRDYMARRESGRLEMHVRQLVTSGGKKRIVLKPLREADNSVTFLAGPEDAQLFEFIRLAPRNTTVRDASGFVVGSLLKVNHERRGAGVVARLNGRVVPTAAILHLRYVSMKKPIVIEAKTLTVNPLAA